MSAVVPPHAPNCFGCGPGNDAGLGLVLSGDGERLGGEITLDARFEGAPGLAHGGTIATILDDASGRFMYLTGEPAVTRRIEVDYLARVPIGRPLRVEAWIGARDERELEIRSELRDGGTPLARAKALMRFVSPEHFLIAADADGGIAAQMARTGLNAHTSLPIKFTPQT